MDFPAHLCSGWRPTLIDPALFRNALALSGVVQHKYLVSDGKFNSTNSSVSTEVAQRRKAHSISSRDRQEPLVLQSWHVGRSPGAADCNAFRHRLQGNGLRLGGAQG